MYGNMQAGGSSGQRIKSEKMLCWTCLCVRVYVCMHICMHVCMHARGSRITPAPYEKAQASPYACARLQRTYVVPYCRLASDSKIVFRLIFHCDRTTTSETS